MNYEVDVDLTWTHSENEYGIPYKEAVLNPWVSKYMNTKNTLITVREYTWTTILAVSFAPHGRVTIGRPMTLKMDKYMFNLQNMRVAIMAMVAAMREYHNVGNTPPDYDKEI